jgi:LemA protein
MVTGIVLLAIIVAAIVLVISIYNRLIALRNRHQNAWAQIDVQLQRRHDLIPNLVETARAYMAHERETLEKVIAARGAAVSAQKAVSSGSGVEQLARAEGALNGALANFFALSENYPQLKADGTMAQLMEELSSTENKVGFARQAYNDAVMNYNTYREQFPGNLVAGFFSFKAAESWEVEAPEARKAVQVSFR